MIFFCNCNFSTSFFSLCRAALLRLLIIGWIDEDLAYPKYATPVAVVWDCASGEHAVEGIVLRVFLWRIRKYQNVHETSPSYTFLSALFCVFAVRRKDCADFAAKTLICVMRCDSVFYGYWRIQQYFISAQEVAFCCVKDCFLRCKIELFACSDSAFCVLKSVSDGLICSL